METSTQGCSLKEDFMDIGIPNNSCGTKKREQFKFKLYATEKRSLEMPDKTA